jgi:hypothetical protein
VEAGETISRCRSASRAASSTSASTARERLAPRASVVAAEGAVLVAAVLHAQQARRTSSARRGHGRHDDGGSSSARGDRVRSAPSTSGPPWAMRRSAGSERGSADANPMITVRSAGRRALGAAQRPGEVCLGVRRDARC